MSSFWQFFDIQLAIFRRVSYGPKCETSDLFAYFDEYTGDFGRGVVVVRVVVDQPD